LLRGRFFTRADARLKICLTFRQSCRAADVPRDGEDGEPAIVNQAFVRRFYGSVDPIGQRFYTGEATGKSYWYRIVGVVGDMRRQGLERQAVPEYFDQLIPSTTDLVVRVDGDPMAIASTIRDV